MQYSEKIETKLKIIAVILTQLPASFSTITGGLSEPGEVASFCAWQQ